MKINIFCFFCFALFCCNNGYSQNEVNPDWEKHINSRVDTIIYKEKSNIIDTFLVIDYSPYLKIEISFGGESKSVKSYLFGIPNGVYISNHTNGFIKDVGYFANGYKTGPWITWFDDGTIKSYEEYYIDSNIILTSNIPDSIICNYTDTIYNEEYTEFYEYSNTMKNGLSIYFNKNGEVIEKLYSIMGIPCLRKAHSPTRSVLCPKRK